MTYDPTHADYFNPESLQTELLRVYDICHSCRLCFNLCPSFPALFDAIDAHEEAGEGETEALNESEIWRVVDLCYNCKLCYPKCPYTPPHKFDIDFPRLMLRANAVQAKKKGISWQNRVLGRPDVVGKLGSMTAPVANVANKLGATRVMMEKTIGLHRDFNLPQFVSLPFARWFRRQQKKRPPIENPVAKVALFSTCTGNYNEVDSSKALVQVLWHHNIEVVMPEQTCCGMPVLDGGNVEGAKRQAKKNVDAFVPLVEQGYVVVIPGPTCSFMFKDDYPALLKTEAAVKISTNTFDACEFLMRLHKEKKLRTDFKTGPGKVGYHIPCHLRVQNIGFKSRDLMQLLPDTQVTVVEKCSVVDGTWGMKSQNFEVSQKWAKKLYRGLEDSGADVYASDCPLSRQQIVYGTGRAARHPVELVRDAYGLEPLR